MRREEELRQAVAILELPDTATLNEIRTAYRRLLRRWHPDTCPEGTEICNEKVKEIVEAYELLMDYCVNYRFSFKSEDLQKSSKNDFRTWWRDHFGDDPMWSKGST